MQSYLLKTLFLPQNVFVIIFCSVKQLTSLSTKYLKVTEKPLVLIVEDNVDLAEATKHFLEMKRFKVVTSDGTNLMELIDNIKPNVIILDIFLGALDGRELCKQIKQKDTTKTIPVIMLSAHDKLSKAYDDDCADGYVMKPFALNELLQEIQLLIKLPE